MDDREKDEFDRIRLAAKLERNHELVEKYEEGMRYVWNEIANARYNLGKLDERLEGGS
jgi:hypothetical protein